MSYLKNIGSDVQKYAEVIQNVLRVEVTIADDNFCRVAGTGRYSELIGDKIGMGTVFVQAIENCKSFFIDAPRNCCQCNICSEKNRCTEAAEVCCPIILEDKAIGVIGLVAFEEKQREALISNRKGLMEFLTQMADLISSRVQEGEMLIRNRLLRKQLETIIDTIDEGIIAVNEKGEVTHCSYSARKIFEIEDGTRVLGVKIESVCPELASKIINTENISNREFIVNKKNGTRGVFSTRTIIYNNNFQGTVIVIRTISDVRKIINHVSGNSFNIYFEDIIGNSKILMDAKEKAIKAAAGISTVFIMGESGTGKELFARAIHSSSSRKDKPFVAVNCAAIPEALLESELFGYEEGAFTGAKRGGKIGKFELANGGTIFLDEVGDMPLHLQTKLLRVLQERSIERVGGQQTISLNIKVIAATHKNIMKMLEEGEFRQDLFYRLNVIPIIIPPLRERIEDIPLLMRHILKKCNFKLKKDVCDFSNDVYEILKSYNWPGNIRELENTIEYAVNMENTELIGANSLPQKFKKVEKNQEVVSEIVPIKELERLAIINALNIMKNNREEAYKALGISRATFYRKLKEYDINI